jgi:hypothetical protein
MLAARRATTTSARVIAESAISQQWPREVLTLPADTKKGNPIQLAQPRSEPMTPHKDHAHTERHSTTEARPARDEGCRWNVTWPAGFVQFDLPAGTIDQMHDVAVFLPGWQHGSATESPPTRVAGLMTTMADIPSG